MGTWQHPAAGSTPTTGDSTAAEIEAYRARVALTGVVDVAGGTSSPAVVLRALAHLIGEDAMERGALESVSGIVGDLEALAAKVERGAS
jgi:hypothetical protein